MEERRKMPRRRTYLGGEIAYHPLCAKLTCEVRNLSANGAKLRFSRPALFPDSFDLTITQSDERRRARLIWRNDTEAGVSFSATVTAQVIPFEARNHAASQADHAILARRIAQITDRKKR